MSESAHTRFTVRPHVGALVPSLLRWLLLLALVLLFVLGWLTRWLPQMPAYVTTPTDARAWLLTVTPHVPYGQQLAAWGLFALTRTPLFQGLLLGAMLATWAHLGYLFYLGRWLGTHPTVPPLSPQAAEGGAVRRVSRPLRDVFLNMQRYWQRRGTLVEEPVSFEEIRLFVREGRGGWWGSLLAFVGVLGVLTGVYLAVTQGWETRPTVLTPEQPWDVGHGTDIRVTLLAREAASPAAGPMFFVQHRRHPNRNRVYALRPGEVLRVEGVELRYLDAPLGLMLQVNSAAGTPLPLQEPTGRAGKQVALLFPTSGAEQVVIVPTYGYQIRVVGYTALPERGFTDPVFLVQVLAPDGETVIRSTFITQSTTLDAGPLSLQVRLVRHARVQAAAYPGRGLAWAGALAFLLGAAWALWRGPYRRWWIRLHEAPFGTVVQVWGDQYNMGWHAPIRGTDVWPWGQETHEGSESKAA